MNLDEIAVDLERDASRFGLKINTIKARALSMIDQRTPPIYSNRPSIEGVVNQFVQLGSVIYANAALRVNQFVQLGSVIYADGGTELNVAQSIKSARCAFVTLSSWNCSVIAIFLCCCMGAAH